MVDFAYNFAAKMTAALAVDIVCARRVVQREINTSTANIKL